MKLKRIEEPPREIFQHGLTEQELLALPPDKAAMAKDWNIANKKLDWLIREFIDLNNFLVEFLGVLEGIKTITKVVGYVIASAGGIYGLLKIVGAL
jgi:hypothetical protein